MLVVYVKVYTEPMYAKRSLYSTLTSIFGSLYVSETIQIWCFASVKDRPGYLFPENIFQIILDTVAASMGVGGTCDTFLVSEKNQTSISVCPESVSDLSVRQEGRGASGRESEDMTSEDEELIFIY